jgi:hypothetical protein
MKRKGRNGGGEEFHGEENLGQYEQKSRDKRSLASVTICDIRMITWLHQEMK